MLVTLFEGYLRAVNRNSKKLQILNQSLTSQPFMKRLSLFFGLVFFTFLWLQIYKAIAATFWQFASYVPIFFFYDSFCTQPLFVSNIRLNYLTHINYPFYT